MQPCVIDEKNRHSIAVMELMPLYQDIPGEFKRGLTKWNRLFADAFFEGLQSVILHPKDGIDKHVAWRHIRTIMMSWEPKHEHKEAAVAYLCSLWFDDVEWVAMKKGPT